MTATPSPQSVVVPVEPTEAMIEAFYHAEGPAGPDRVVSWSVATAMARGNVFRHLDDIFANAYRAMLAAAPAPSSLAGGEVWNPYQITPNDIAAILDENADCSDHGGGLLNASQLARKIWDAGLAALSPEAPARSDAVWVERDILEPFQMGEITSLSDPEDIPDDTIGTLRVRMGDLRRLRDVLNPRHLVGGKGSISHRIDMAIVRETLRNAVVPPALTPRHEAPASDGEREPLCMAYKTGYADGVEDSNGMFDRESCEEGWGQYAEKLSAQSVRPARLPLPTVDDGRGGRRPINPQDDR